MSAPLALPSEKERKYDRQLRLWAASGQKALESANVLLVNTNAGNAGFEAMKNMVLPGIGRFTIADEAVVEDADLGINFFLDETCLGKPRALCCRDNLVELNPDVTGDWFPKEPGNFDLENLMKESLPYTIILHTLPPNSNHLTILQRYANERSIPLLAVRNSGYYAFFTVRLPNAFPVVETHPDEEATADLRLLDPWVELSDFATNITRDFNNQDSHEHGHVPFVAILLHYLERWKSEHQGHAPCTYREKLAFREAVAHGARKSNPEGGEENFDEAISAVMKHISKSSLPANLKQIFEHLEHANENLRDNFWLTARAVKKFYEQHGQLPLPGGLPDMKAQSTVYIELQRLYKEKANRDVGEVLELLGPIAGEVSVSRDEVELFCKNARFIKLVLSSRDAPDIHQIVDDELVNDECSMNSGLQTPLSLLPILLVLRSAAFTQGCTSDEIVDDITKQIPKLKGNERLHLVAEELSRTECGELHNVSAALGGMVAQEMIKIITKQYIPVDNTCIFDGLESRCQVLRWRS